MGAKNAIYELLGYEHYNNGASGSGDCAVLRWGSYKDNWADIMCKARAMEQGDFVEFLKVVECEMREYGQVLIIFN